MKFFGAIILAAATYSTWATPILDQKISVTAKKITVIEAMEQISKQSGIKFIFSPTLKPDKVISLDVKYATLSDVMDFLAVEMGGKWERTGNSIKISAIN